jgi:hypothetical protein
MLSFWRRQLYGFDRQSTISEKSSKVLPLRIPLMQFLMILSLA